MNIHFLYTSLIIIECRRRDEPFVRKVFYLQTVFAFCGERAGFSRTYFGCARYGGSIPCRALVWNGNYISHSFPDLFNAYMIVN